MYDHIAFRLQDAVPLRLSSHQINLLLSSIWAQSISPANLPEDYVAIAHTYSLMLLFSRAKVIFRLTNLLYSVYSIFIVRNQKLCIVYAWRNHLQLLYNLSRTIGTNP